MLKRILLLPKRLRRRYSCASIIQRFDRETDQSTGPIDGFLHLGYQKSTIDDVLSIPNFSQKMRESPLRTPPKEGKNIIYSWDMPDFLWEAILGSSRLQSIVQSYLGTDVRLDDIYIKTVKDGLSSTSEGWHDDNVGYRLKVFLVFDTEGHPASTYVLPAKRPKLYTVQFINELKRMISKPSLEHIKDEIKIDYQAGDCLILDTNILHRGDYNTALGTRYCVVVEFINRHKANCIYGKAPCGPGQGQQSIKIPFLAGIDVFNHPLIDNTLLKKGKSNYTYGYQD